MLSGCQWWLWMLVAVVCSLYGGLVEARLEYLECLRQRTTLPSAITLQQDNIKAVSIEQLNEIDLKCETGNQGGQITIIEGWTFHPSNNEASVHSIPKNQVSTKYSMHTNTLTVYNLSVSDEGVYVCNFSLNNGPLMEALGGGVIILGSPFIAPCCTENINKYSGQDIVFNATLEFRNSGACMQHVEIEKRTLEKDSVEFVTCPISNSSDCTTTNSERIKASITETTMVVTISNATQIDSGTYKFFPTTILFRILTKTFIVTVLEPSTSVIPVSTSATTNTSLLFTPTMIPGKTSRKTGLKSDGIAAVVVTLLVVPLLVVFVIVAVIYFFRWWNKPPKIPPKMRFIYMKQTEPFYDNVNIIPPCNGSVHMTSEECPYPSHAPSSIAGDRTSQNMEDVMLAEKPTDEEANV